MNVTKNTQSEEKIRELTKAVFPDAEYISSYEVTDGMCNAIYVVEIKEAEANENRKVVLKIAAADRRGLLRNEPCLMKTEVTSMKIAEENLSGENYVPVPKVIFHSEDREYCGAEFFFMEYVDGVSMGKLRRTLSDDEKKKLYTEVGRIVRKITSHKGEKFGIVGSGVEFDSFYELFEFMFDNVLLDSEETKVDITVPYDEVRELLRKNKEIFDEVKVPSLVHFDIWENNLIIKDGEIVGVLDWERALFGDPLMEERFRAYCKNEDFYRGYGLTSPTPTEERRMWFYDLWIATTWMTETFLREYETDGQYHWAKDLFRDAWNKLTANE